MPVVQMPDGTMVDVPDKPTPEQLAALQAIQAKQTAPKSEWSLGSLASDIGRGGLNMIDAVRKTYTTPKTPIGMVGFGLTALRDKLGSMVGTSQPGEVMRNEMQPHAEEILPTPKGDSAGRTYARKALEGVGSQVCASRRRDGAGSSDLGGSWRRRW